MRFLESTFSVLPQTTDVYSDVQIKHLSAVEGLQHIALLIGNGGKGDHGFHTNWNDYAGSAPGQQGYGFCEEL